MKIACYIRNARVYDEVRSSFARSGLDTIRFDSEMSLLRMLKRSSFDAIILDQANFSGEDNVFSWLKLRSGDRTPVLVLSPVHNAEVAAKALDAGADDFLARPFEPIELVARMNAVLRRAMPAAPRRTIELHGFMLDREASRFSFGGKDVALTPREFRIAWLLFSSPGIYISRETLGSVIWSSGDEITGRTIEQHVYTLRKKLQALPRQLATIRTAYSHGYRLELSTEAEMAAGPATPSRSSRPSLPAIQSVSALAPLSALPAIPHMPEYRTRQA